MMCNPTFRKPAQKAPEIARGIVGEKVFARQLRESATMIDEASRDGVPLTGAGAMGIGME